MELRLGSYATNRGCAEKMLSFAIDQSRLAMNVFNKIKWVFIIAVVFSLILATNLIDKRNFRSISESIVSIYEDRLAVKNIILDLATCINKKEVAFLTQDTLFLTAQNASLSATLSEDIKQFEQTNVTEREIEALNLLKEDIELMVKEEQELVRTNFANYANYKKIIKDLNEHLDVLAHIQMREGKKHMISSQRKLSTVELFTQIETYLLFFLATVALIIIFYKPRA